MALRQQCSARSAHAKPDADFSLRPLGTRVRDLLWEVMLQAKVIRERPLPGLAHAFVFWGFCAFALITLNHFAIGFGVPFLNSRFGEFLLPVGGAHSRVLVAISIVGTVHPPVYRAPEVAGRAVVSNPA